MTSKELLLYIGPKSSGKSWFCVHCGKQAFLEGARVVHVSLEFDKELIAGRYFQALFGAGMRNEIFNQTTMEFDKLGRLLGWKTRPTSPKWVLSDPASRRELAKRMKPWGARLGRLLIVDFPSGRLTMSQLEAYLDFLEVNHSFVPNVLIIDYPKLMRLDPRNLRIDLGQTVVELRGLAKARNLALVAPHQGNRDSLTAKHVRSNMAGEDISVIQTADTVLAYSRTPAEERCGLARLSVEHARGSRSHLEVILTQSYDTGQYVLASTPMANAYWERWKELGGDVEDE